MEGDNDWAGFGKREGGRMDYPCGSESVSFLLGALLLPPFVIV